MYRWLVCTFCVVAAMAQTPQRPQRPQTKDAAAQLLDSVPAGSIEFPRAVLSVMQAYSHSSMTARARSVLQQALDRTAALGDSHPNRIALLGMLSRSWREDGNLLKATAYLEQAAAAQKSVNELSRLYQDLADLYRELGRSEALDATLIKIRALPNAAAYSQDNPRALFLERQGLIEEAIAVYWQDIERAPAGPGRAVASEALASLYQRQQRYGDAVDVLQRAVDATGTADLSQLNQNLADALQQAGRTAEADRVYRDLLNGDPGIETLIQYAAHLDATARAGQAEDVLKQYQASHPGLDAGEADSLLIALSQAAFASGGKDRGEEYFSAISGMQLSSVPFIEEVAGRSGLQKADAAAAAGKPDEALNLALHAIEACLTAADVESAITMVPIIADVLASKSETGKAEQLYQRLSALAENQARDTLTPLLGVSREYVRLLISQPSRWSAVTSAIARHRDLLTQAHGAESGALEETAMMTVDFEVRRESPGAAMAAAQELLSLQESISGNTSEPYLQAIVRVAGVYEVNGAAARALDLHRQAVRIADLVYPAADARRGMVRIEAAFALARQERFDEAEQLAMEAVKIGQAARPFLNERLSGQLEQIRAMRPAPMQAF